MGIHFPKAFPELDLNDHYYLREHNEEDIESFFAYYTPAVNQYIIAPKPVNIQEAKAEIHYCKNLFHFRRGIYWTIADNQQDRMIGAIGLTIDSLNRRAELHYDLAEQYWGQGIMSSAIQLVMHYAFQELKLMRIEAITMQANTASHRVLTKNHFKHEGTLHAYKYFDHRPVDVEIFAITLAQYTEYYGNT